MGSTTVNKEAEIQTKGKTRTLLEEIGDKILMRRNGRPAFELKHCPREQERENFVSNMDTVNSKMYK